MELPRRRGGAYEHGSVIGNILAPISGAQASADTRTTPSSRGAPAARPPWATEMDTSYSIPPAASTRPAATPRQGTHDHVSRANQDFSFQPTSKPASERAGHAYQPSPTSHIHAGDYRSTSWDEASGPLQRQASNTTPRPTSSGRASAPTDQLDLWTQQQQYQHHQQHQYEPHYNQANHAEGLYVNLDHVEGPYPSPSLARRTPAVPTSTPVPARPASGNHSSGAGGASPTDAVRLQSGNLSSADVEGARRGVPPRRGVGVAGGRGAGGSTPTPGRSGAARVTASPARSPPPQQPPIAAGTSAGNASHTPSGRSASTPKPRPAVPPKRSTSITDNVRRDWVDAGTSERSGGVVSGRSRGEGGDGGSRWDADPDGSDRGSWLFVHDDPPPQPNHGQEQELRQGQSVHSSSAGNRNRGMQVADATPEPPVANLDGLRRRASERPNANRTAEPQSPSAASGVSAAAAAAAAPMRTAAPAPSRSAAVAGSGRGSGGSSISSNNSRAASHGTTTPEATLSPAAVLKAATGGGDGGMSLGHGASAGDLCGGGGGAASGRRGTGSSSSGLSQAEASRQMQALQDENARLRDQVEHLNRLLAVSAPPLPAAASSGRPSSAASAVGDPGVTSLAAAASAGVALQQYKSQVIQLQRQVAMMSQEIEAKSRLALEAEGVLLEAASKLTDLASGASGSGTASADVAAGAVAAGILAGADGCGGDEPLSRELLLAVAKWSRQMLGRLRSEKSQSSKLFTHQAQDRRGAGGCSMLPPTSSSWGAPGDSGAASGPSWQVPFIPAGGNRFLLSGASNTAAAGGGGGGSSSTTDDTASATTPSVSVAALCCGRGVLLADPVLAHRCEVAVAGLGPRLAALAVAVRTQLLPAMPWLGLEAADRMQAEVAEVAASAAQASAALLQLCALLPAGAVPFGDTPVTQEPRRRAAEVEAGRDSWLYGAPESLEAAAEAQQGAANEDGTIDVPRLQAAIAPLLRDRKTGPKALGDILEPVRARTQAAAATRSLLEAELRFAARAAALHSEHVSHLMLSVGLALQEGRKDKDAGAIRAAFAAGAAVRQVLAAADALEVHPCENCLKALVDVVRSQRGQLEAAPELLLNSPAADVEGRLLNKVEELHQGFKKALSRLDAHKRRQLDAAAHGARQGAEGGACGAEGGTYDDDGDGDGDSQCGEEGGSAAVASAPQLQQQQQGYRGTGGSSRPPRPPASQQQQQQVGMGADGSGSGTAKGSGRPPKPRPEWTD